MSFAAFLTPFAAAVVVPAIFLFPLGLAPASTLDAPAAGILVIFAVFLTAPCLAFFFFFVARQPPGGSVLDKPEPRRVQRERELVRHQRSHRHGPLRLRVRPHIRSFHPRLPDEDGQETDELLQDAGSETKHFTSDT